MCFERITHALSQPENVVKALSIHKRDELDWRIASGWDVLAQGVQASRQLEKINIEIQAKYGESRGTGDEYVIRDELRHSLKLVNPQLKWFWFRWHALKHEWECWCRDHLVATDAAFRTSYNAKPRQKVEASREVLKQYFEGPMIDWLENTQRDDAPELRSLRLYVSPSRGISTSARGMFEARRICDDRGIQLILDEHGHLPEDFDWHPDPALPDLARPGPAPRFGTPPDPWSSPLPGRLRRQRRVPAVVAMQPRHPLADALAGLLL